MTPPVIRIENLGKRYLLSHRQGGQYENLRDVIAQGAASLGRRLLNPLGGSRCAGDGTEEFWALREVSFQVEKGERIGIIGRNGAGKSTLLKILSRITEPSTGKIRIRGRVASLLEVGTGFHPELTGRENIYLNGAILGMRREEIRRKFDAIVDFAEVERFLDTPVKRYSSGMYVRLAFAVAAHLEPEILVVDEVLAVGDAQFQKKCLGKMEEAGREGRTVLFVSHNMAAIQQLCDRAILLDKGGIALDDRDVALVVRRHLAHGIDVGNKLPLWRAEQPGGSDYFRVDAFGLCDLGGTPVRSATLSNDEDRYLVIDFTVAALLRDLRFGIVIYGEDGTPLLTSECTDEADVKQFSFAMGPNRMAVRLPGHFLNEGVYFAEITSSSPSVGWILHPGKDACPRIRFEISGGLSNSPCWTSRRAGVVAPVFEWLPL